MAKEARKKLKKNHSQQLLYKKVAILFITFGLGLVIFSLLILFLTFYPVLKVELRYQIITKTNSQQKEITPVNTDFAIVIPKIAANAKVIQDVNPNDEKEYQYQLSKGVAHAKGTAYPGENGNIFLFAHSSLNWYLANRYNSIFYLLNKLENITLILLYYKNKKYLYKVFDKKIVNAQEISYLTNKSNSKTVTLMTCWPPGTTFRRLIILGKLIE